jgi:hypothetical protein
MPADFSIARWVQAVPSRQWATEARQLAELPAEVPETIVGSRALSEVHRLDLALFVVFEESALRVSGALVRKAPTPEALRFAAQQTLDEAHHYEVFQQRSDASRQAAGLVAGPIDPAILTPPLRRFIEHCYEVADTGSFIEGLALTNLVLEGMAYPLYAYEEAYWGPVDPYLARLIHGAFTDETRHVHFGAQLVRELLAQDPEQRARVARQCQAARVALAEVFRYYVRTFVGLFDAVARRHQNLFRGAEIAPGRRIADTPYEEQVAMIHHSIDREHTRLLAQAGLSGGA